METRLQKKRNDMSEENQQQPVVDPTRVGCRVIDVHSALQKAFAEFAESGETSLDDLVRRVHGELSELPAFLIGDAPNQ